MSITTNLKLNETIVPCVPFIWYREQEFVCPFDYITELNNIKAKELFNIDHDMFVIVQRNISDTNNLYICLHTVLYYELHKNNIQDNLLTVPNNFAINISFEVQTIPIDAELNELHNGLKNNQSAIGHVHIHNNAFSPPGCLHFKINLDKKSHMFFCNIKCTQLNINMNCLFVLFNDVKESCDKEIAELLLKLT